MSAASIFARPSERTWAFLTAARASDTFPGSFDRFMNAAAGSPTTRGVQRDCFFGLGQGLRVRCLPRPVCQAFPHLDEQVPQICLFIAEFRQLANLIGHLLGGIERRRPRRAVGRDVLPDVGVCPQHAAPCPRANPSGWTL